MKVQYGKDVASHSGPESCGGAREGAAEALTGETGGSAIEPRNQEFGTPMPLSDADGNTNQGDSCESWNGSARSETLYTPGSFPAQKLGDLRRARRDDAGQSREGQVPHAWIPNCGEVGCACSTWEAVEQGSQSRGDGGGKERSQRKCQTGLRTPDSEPDQLCVDGPKRCT